jgi:hypothetical protein
VLSIPLENILRPIQRVCRTNTSWHRHIVAEVPPLKSVPSFLFFAELGEESELGLAESSNVWKYCGKIGVRYTNP